ncbi:MAG TPA: SRPBCC family protein [Solirubrobacterales bacterium]
MAERFGATVVVDRPIEQVFDFLANGENDPKFSPRVMEIANKTGGAPAKGTVYASTVKDAGMKSQREFELTEFERPGKIRWTELSKNAVVVPEGGYDLEAAGDGTSLTFFNELEGHGFGKLIVGFALRAARKDADNFAGRMKAAIEAS